MPYFWFKLQNIVKHSIPYDCISLFSKCWSIMIFTFSSRCMCICRGVDLYTICMSPREYNHFHISWRTYSLCRTYFGPKDFVATIMQRCLRSWLSRTNITDPIEIDRKFSSRIRTEPEHQTFRVLSSLRMRDIFKNKKWLLFRLFIIYRNLEYWWLCWTIILTKQLF